MRTIDLEEKIETIIAILGLLGACALFGMDIFSPIAPLKSQDLDKHPPPFTSTERGIMIRNSICG